MIQTCSKLHTINCTHCVCACACMCKRMPLREQCVLHTQFRIFSIAASKSSLIIPYAIVESIDGLTILMLWTSLKLLFFPLCLSFLNFSFHLQQLNDVLLFQRHLRLHANFSFSLQLQYDALLFQHLKVCAQIFHSLFSSSLICFFMNIIKVFSYTFPFISAVQYTSFLTMS